MNSLFALVGATTETSSNIIQIYVKQKENYFVRRLKDTDRIHDIIVYEEMTNYAYHVKSI